MIRCAPLTLLLSLQLASALPVGEYRVTTVAPAAAAPLKMQSLLLRIDAASLHQSLTLEAGA